VQNLINVPAEIRVHHLCISALQQVMDCLYRVQGTAARTVGILFRLEVHLEDGLQDSHHGCLAHPICDSRETEGTQSPRLPRFGNLHPPHGVGTIRLRSEGFRQFTQPPRPPIRFDIRNRLVVPPGAPPLAAYSREANSSTSARYTLSYNE
jgi:hypothetical protein